MFNKNKISVGDNLYRVENNEVKKTTILSISGRLIIIEEFKRDYGQAVIEKHDLNSRNYGWWTDKREAIDFSIKEKEGYILDHERDIAQLKKLKD